MRAMSKSLRIQRQKVRGRGNGWDLQAGYSVAGDWLRRETAGVAHVGRRGKGTSSDAGIRALEGSMPQ